MRTVLRAGLLPADCFAVVMATGIVSVAARDNGYALVSVALAVLASVELGVLMLFVATRQVMSGHAFAAGPDAVTRTFALFTFVAACDVVDARLGPGVTVLAAVLWLVALAAWVYLVPRLWAALRSFPRWRLLASARGSWLLAAVATHSLTLTAAQLAGAGVAAPALLGLALAGWVLGLLAYVVISVVVVRRLLVARAVPEVLSPDMWVLMGALAIGIVSGGTLSLVADGSTVYGWLPDMLGPALFVLWAVGSGWIPLLVAGEIRRARRVRPRYERARWSTVFPLGMYSSACAVLATGAGVEVFSATAWRGLSEAFLWVAVTLGGATAVGLGRLGWQKMRYAHAVTLW